MRVCRSRTKTTTVMSTRDDLWSLRPPQKLISISLVIENMFTMFSVHASDISRGRGAQRNDGLLELSKTTVDLRVQELFSLVQMLFLDPPSDLSFFQYYCLLCTSIITRRFFSRISDNHLEGMESALKHYFLVYPPAL